MSQVCTVYSRRPIGINIVANTSISELRTTTHCETTSRKRAPQNTIPTHLFSLFRLILRSLDFPLLLNQDHYLVNHHNLWDTSQIQPHHQIRLINAIILVSHDPLLSFPQHLFFSSASCIAGLHNRPHAQPSQGVLFYVHTTHCTQNQDTITRLSSREFPCGSRKRLQYASYTL